jgi:hypothetical protein
MKLTILIIITMLGLLIPLFWITGTFASITYFFVQWLAAFRKERTVVLNPQLGITMADGGDSINKVKKD